jgi:hypothetical protein
LGQRRRPVDAGAAERAGSEVLHPFERVHERALRRYSTCTAPPKGPCAPENLTAYLERAERRATPRTGEPGVGLPAGAGPSVSREVASTPPPRG